jgi:hypothetical protein
VLTWWFGQFHPSGAAEVVVGVALGEAGPFAGIKLAEVVTRTRASWLESRRGLTFANRRSKLGRDQASSRFAITSRWIWLVPS